MKQLSDYQRLNKYNFSWVIKKAIEGKTYDAIFTDDLLKAFVTQLVGVNLLKMEDTK